MKKFLFGTMMVAAMIAAAGCGKKESTTTQTTAQAEQSSAKAEDTKDAKTVEGTIEEKKENQFILDAKDGKSYLFAFYDGTKPEGYEGVTQGDTVTVSYTGDLPKSDADSFTGKVVSIKKQEKSILTIR